MFFSSAHNARPIAKMIRKATSPGLVLSRLLPSASTVEAGVSNPDTAFMPGSLRAHSGGLVRAPLRIRLRTRRDALRRLVLPHPGEQIVLRQRGVDQRARQLEVLGRPHRAPDVVRGAEERAVGVDLGGVG